MKTSRERTLMAATLAALACSSPAPEQREQSIDSARTRPTRVRTAARPCRADSFFVEIPVGLANVWPDLAFLAQSKADLESYLGNHASQWFCPPSQPTCLNGQVAVAIESVLPARAWPATRADGHLRFLRVRFSDNSGTLSVQPDWQCDAVEEIRSTIADRNGLLADDEFYVGRECDASVASAQAVPTHDMLTWHLTDIGLPASEGVSAPASSEELVDLALIDAGVGAALHASLGVTSVTDLHPNRTNHHVHGRGMATFARQVGPSLRMTDIAVLDAGGQGTMADVAIGIDAALFGGTNTSPPRPLVLQMSLGFPPELAQPAGISGVGGSCTSHENAAGEVIRYMLDVAARMDRDGQRPVFVSAASGNRAVRVPAGTFPAPPANVLHVTCGATPNTPALYYPGQWSQEATCRVNDPTITHAAIAVGAVDERLRATGVAIPGAETPLVAPGQHVYAANSAAHGMPMDPICGAGGTNDYLDALPRAFTGSSVSAALVAGAAARAQHQRLMQGDAPLTRLALARVLYLTGRDLCRSTAAGVPVRMLAVDRLDHALRSCPALVACAQNIVGTEPIPAGTLAACATEVQACGFAPACTTPSRPGPITWDPNYTSKRIVCGDATATAPWQDVSACGAQCPFESHPERTAIGSLGPQPMVPLCPDCPAQFEPGKIVMSLELTADGDPKTAIENPYLVLNGPPLVNGKPTEEYIALPTAPDVDWALGNHLDIEVDLNGSSIDFSNLDDVKAGLVVNITEPDAKTVTDFSAIDLHH
ncbi:MAG: S8 family serine peptidase [Deltaproteobacteria bacterium]